MATHTSAEPSTLTSRPPYPPSWLDRLQTRLEQGRMPPGAVYAALWAVPFLAITLSLWLDGTLAVGVLPSFHAVLWGTGVLALALMHYLDLSAAAALEAFRPALTVCDEAYADLAYRLTHLPAGRARWAALAGLAVAGAEVATLPRGWREEVNLLSSAPGAIIEIGMYALGWVSLATLAYHTVHQLRVVHHVYRECTRINLFRLGPIYSFSWLTGRTAFGLALIPHLFLLGSTELYSRPAEPGWFAAVVGVTVLAGFVFAWPLWGVHILLEREKARLVREVSSRFETAVLDLHASADARAYGQVDGLNKLISTLLLEQSALEKISTWPWRPETPRLLATALLLPLLAFVAQRVLASVLGF